MIVLVSRDCVFHFSSRENHDFGKFINQNLAFCKSWLENWWLSVTCSKWYSVTSGLAGGLPNPICSQATPKTNLSSRLKFHFRRNNYCLWDCKIMYLMTDPPILLWGKLWYIYHYTRRWEKHRTHAI